MVAAVAIGNAVGAKNISMQDANVGQSRQADQILSKGFPQADPQTEFVLVRNSARKSLWRVLLARRVALVLAASTIAVGGPGLGTISTYLPAYLKSGLHLGQITVGVVFTAVMAASVAALRRRLPGYATATPDTLQRRFLNTGSIIENDRRQTTIRLSRRTYSPILRQASMPDTITIPWWEGRMLRYQYDRPDRGPIRLVKIGVSWLRPPGPAVVEQPWYFSVICSYPPRPAGDRGDGHGRATTSTPPAWPVHPA